MCVDASIQGTTSSLFGHDVSTPHSPPFQVLLDRTPKNEPERGGGSEEKKGQVVRWMGVCITAVGAVSQNPNLLDYKHSIFEIGSDASMILGNSQKNAQL